MDSVLPRISSGSDHVYNYMSQNISILLVAATTFVFVLWCFRIVRSFLASTSFLVSLHNETVRPPLPSPHACYSFLAKLFP